MSAVSTAFTPLFNPEQDARDWVPPLDIACSVAREVLEEHQGDNVHDHVAMVRAAAALDDSLRRVLAALDAEDGGQR